MVRIIVIAMLAAAGCVRGAGAYECSSAAQCQRDGVQGRCESVSVCSFPDPACASGQRFGDYSGEYANQCVGDANELPDAGMPDGPAAPDGSNPDASMTDAMMLSCPVGYAAMPGVTTHLYRKVVTAAGWSTHMTACATDGANAYLAIPNDATELAALVTLANADVWVGITDTATEGTFQTVRGAIATFLPWSASEPDNNGNQDCVGAKKDDGKLETLQCTTSHVAICECEP
jgi:hypothetical protein